MSTQPAGQRPASEASLRGRIRAYERWARVSDRTAATAPGRRGLEARFEREVDPNGELDPAERARRLDAKHKAHFSRLALASVRSRRHAREAREAAGQPATAGTAPRTDDDLPSPGRSDTAAGPC